MNLTTTIEKIYAHRPYMDTFAKLVVNIFGVDADPESPINEQIELLTPEQRTSSVTLLQILDINGIHDALWALRCWDYRDYCLLLADIIEPSGQYSDCPAVRNMATTIRRWHSGDITDADLAAAAAAVADAARVKVVTAWSMARSMAWAAAWAAAAAADAAWAVAVAWAAVEAVEEAVAAAAAASGNAEWSRIEQLMRDFCAEKEKVTE